MKMWCLFYPATEEEYVAPSHEVAQLMCEKGVRDMREWIEESRRLGRHTHVELNHIAPRVRLFSGTQGEYLLRLREFKLDEWCIDLNSLKWDGGLF